MCLGLIQALNEKNLFYAFLLKAHRQTEKAQYACVRVTRVRVRARYSMYVRVRVRMCACAHVYVRVRARVRVIKVRTYAWVPGAPGACTA